MCLAAIALATIVRRFAGNAASSNAYKAFVAWMSFIAFWEAAIYVGIFHTMLLSPPSVIFEKTLYFLQTGFLQSNIVSTLRRFVLGFSIAVAVAVPLGIVLGLFRRVYEWTEPLLNFMRMIPAPAILPFAIMLLGIGESPAVFVIALGSIFPILLNTVQGVREAEAIHIEVIKTLGGTGVDAMKYVILPSALPTILTGIRIGFGIGWLVLVSAEIVAADSGLGFMIEGARNRVEPPAVFVGMITVCALGLAMDVFLKKAELFLIERRGGGPVSCATGHEKKKRSIFITEVSKWSS